MSKKKAAEKPGKARQRLGDEEVLLKSLRAHGQVLETEDPEAPLAPGQTHVLIRKPGASSGELVEKRKSLFKR
jgi:hypothetical protein